MIRCIDVHKTFELPGRRVEALRGVDLSIEQRGYYAIMGASGSGKSTLMHLLAALDTPTQGSIEIAGQRIEGLNDRQATRFRQESVGIVFQQFNLIATLTARENVELPGMLAGRDAAWLRARSGELLERLGMAERAEHRPQALSGGEQQRVAIARALLFEPPILLADEPTGSLDSVSSQRLWALLGEVAAQSKTTVMLVTHESAAAANCSRIYVMMDGRIKGQFATENLDAAGVATRYQQLVRAA